MLFYKPAFGHIPNNADKKQCGNKVTVCLLGGEQAERDSEFTSLAGFTFLRKEPLDPDAEEAAVLKGFPLPYDTKVTGSKPRAFLIPSLRRAAFTPAPLPGCSEPPSLRGLFRWKISITDDKWKGAGGALKKLRDDNFQLKIDDRCVESVASQYVGSSNFWKGCFKTFVYKMVFPKPGDRISYTSHSLFRVRLPG